MRRVHEQAEQGEQYQKLHHVRNRTAGAMESLFSAIAKHYDAINTLASFGFDRLWRKRAIDKLSHALAATGAPIDRAYIADIACGTGTSSIALARRGAEVFAGDVSYGMLDIGKQRIATLPVQVRQRICFARCDAHHLPLHDTSVDAVTICFGLRNMASREHVFAECARVVKPGGVFMCLEFDNPHHRLWRAIVHQVSSCMVLCVATIFRQNRKPYQYLLQSIKDWPGATYITEQLLAHGFEDVHVYRLGFGIASICIARRAV